MRWKFKLRHIVTAAVNAAAIAGAAVLTLAGSITARSQGYNFAAERWKHSGDMDYSQLSCFLSNDAGFNINEMNSIRSSFRSNLQEASITEEKGKLLFPDAYSTPVGKASVSCDIGGSADAQITAVGGEFFFFRNFRLLDGAYFTEDDIMQDGAVIDERLAWALYGSPNISGQAIYINGVKFYISGVVKTPSTDPEERCIGSAPLAYISYYAAGSVSGDSPGAMYGYGEDFSGMGFEESFDRITCYECVLPEPVENFGYDMMKKQFSEPYKDKFTIVKNSERSDPKVRVKALKQLGDLVVRDDTIIYPFWENASRIVDLKLSYIYGGRRILLAIPLITLIWLAVKGYIWLRRRKTAIKKAAGKAVSAKWKSLRSRLPQKKK
ncbi:MAG: ABC transporter permease [Ruminococcus sp.]|nr:ABC transporter permease [Ruminococcus sp.]